MDFNNNQNYNNGYQPSNGQPAPYGGYPYTPPAKQPGSGLQLAAMILGILSILTACMMTVYLPFIFGSLAIVLALLSKGRFAKLQSRAKTGIICALVGLTLNCFIIGFAVKSVIANPSMMMDTARMYDTLIEQMYGVPSEEILGDSMEHTMSQMYDAFGISE